MQAKKCAAIVLAAVSGKRMKSNVKKQYMQINGRPLIYYSLKAFETFGVNEIILVTSQNEIEYCESKNAQRYQHYAVRFSAKEAVLKALTKYLDDKFSVEWKDIEIVNNETGRPSVVINNKIIEKIDTIDISLSHCKQYGFVFP